MANNETTNKLNKLKNDIDNLFDEALDKFDPEKNPELKKKRQLKTFLKSKLKKETPGQKPGEFFVLLTVKRLFRTRYRFHFANVLSEFFSFYHHLFKQLTFWISVLNSV